MRNDVCCRVSNAVTRVSRRWWVLVGLSAALLAAALLRGWLRGWSLEIAVPMLLLLSNLYLAFRESSATVKRPSDGG